MSLYYGNAILCAGAAYGFYRVNPNFDYDNWFKIFHSLPFVIGFAKGAVGLVKDFTLYGPLVITMNDVFDQCNHSLSLAMINTQIFVEKYNYNKMCGYALLILGIIPPLNIYVTGISDVLRDVASSSLIGISMMGALTHSCYWGLLATLCFAFSTYPVSFVAHELLMDPIELGAAVSGLGYLCFGNCLVKPIKYQPFWK